MKIASYKATRTGKAGVFNRAVRWWLAGPYSHTELVFSDGACGSCSWLDKGVRLKRIDLNPARWDIIDVPDADEAAARAWFEAHAGEPYSLVLLASFVLRWMGRAAATRGHVCSTAVAAALGMPEPWRLDPCSLPLNDRRVQSL